MSGSPIQLVKRYLCVKKLTVNDGFTSKSVKLPRAEARIFMGELRNRQVIPLVLLDEDGSCWELLCTCTGAQYALSRIGAFCEAHGARPGFYFIFYADHDHVVRLAVRQELPEDVQAAVTAARAAAAAIRANPQRAAATQHQPQPGGPAMSNSVVATPVPAGEPVQAASLDDPMSLDEMPTSVARCGGVADDASLSPMASMPVQQLIDAEPPRPMPLQDRSNLPAGSSESATAKSAGKPKPAARKSTQPAAAGDTAPSNVVMAAKPDNKENDAAAIWHPAEKAQSAASSSPLVSSGGLQGPGAVTPPACTPLQPQPAPRPTTPLTPPSLRPTAPAPPLPPPLAPLACAVVQRSLVLQPSLPPATRLRLRFEARLCAQAGKLHPLSVRTGPESPLPSSPGRSGGAAGADWPVTLSGCYALPRSGPLGKELFAVPCGAATAAHCYPACGHLPGGLPTDMQPHHGSAASFGAAVGCMMPAAAQREHHRSHVLHHVLQHHPQRTLPSAPAMPAAPEHDPQSARGDGNQQLQCDESLDWDGGSSGPARATLPGQHQPPQQSCRQYLAPPHSQQEQRLQPGGPGGPAATPQMNLGFVRRLLLLQGSQAASQRLFASWGSVASGDSQAQQLPSLPFEDQQQLQSQQQDGWVGQQQQQHGVEQRSVMQQQPAAQAAAEPTWDELLLSVAASNYSLRRLLGVFRTWAPQARAAAAPPAQPPEENVQRAQPSQGSIPAGGAAASTTNPPTSRNGGCSVEKHAPTWGSDSSSLLPPVDQALADAATSDTEMMDCGPAADTSAPRQPQGTQAQDEAAACGDGGGVRAKSSLSIAREVPGLPADAPRCKRPRPESWQMVARKTLTSHDLLMDRVALSLTPATRALMGKLLLRGEVETGITDSDSTGDGAQKLPQLQEQQAAVGFESGQANQLPERVMVEVVVESGAHYNGVMVARNTSAGGAEAGTGGGAGTGTGAVGASGAGDWELQGLRSYLIRRQAGVGDMLTLGIDSIDGWQRDGCLRLVAQLQQQQTA